MTFVTSGMSLAGSRQLLALPGSPLFSNLWTWSSDLCLRLLVPGVPVREMEGHLRGILWHSPEPSGMVRGVDSVRSPQLCGGLAARPGAWSLGRDPDAQEPEFQ